MRVIVSSCGRFHSKHLALVLHKKKWLEKYFYAGVPADRQYFDSRALGFNYVISFADRLFSKFCLERFISLSRWYTVRDSFFDLWVKKQLKLISPATELFVGWANCSLESFRFLKNRSILIVEAGSMHVLAQEKILQQEFRLQGLRAPPILDENKKRMLEELALADFVAVPSEHVRQSFIDQGISANKIIKIPYGCNVEKFALQKPKRFAGKIIFLFVGMVSLQKGIAYLLQAWDALGRFRKLAELHLIGSVGQDCVVLLKKYTGLENLFLHGPMKQDNLKKWYDLAHVFVLPSLQEGLAMVIGEAMAAGLCIVATDVSGCVELMTPGLHGFMIKSGNAQVLLETMLWCINNPWQVIEMGDAAQKVAQKNTWQDYGERVVRAYQNIIASKTSTKAQTL